MGKTSAAVKNRYNAKAYDVLYINVKKGGKDRYKKIADKMGLSLSQLFVQAADEYIAAHDTEKQSTTHG